MRFWNCALPLAVLGSLFAAAQTAPLQLAQTYELPSVTGSFDHFGIDLGGHRLFAAAENMHAVLVLDLDSGQWKPSIEGLERPHAILYRSDLQRLYITDGGAGAVKIFDGRTLAPRGEVKLLPDTDSIVYDPSSKLLYVVNGGGDAHQIYSMISVVDTTADSKLADIRVDGETLEAMALDRDTPRLFVNNAAKNQVNVLDRNKRTVIGTWPVTRGQHNTAMGFDPASHRLFIGCRSGQLLVMDSQTGEELQALPIDPGVDDVVYDAASHRIYASSGGASGSAGSVSVYHEDAADRYSLLGKVTTRPGARNSLLVPSLHRYFVSAPASAGQPAAVLAFAVQP